MTKKTAVIDFSEDRLLSIANDYVENHNLISALKMLNKNAIVNGNSDASFMLYAEIFDDMQLYEKSINNWYKYIDTGATEDLQDAYEGMALSYMNIGNEKVSAYYYNKLLLEAGEFSQETRQQIIDSFVGGEKKTLKFAYPPKDADYTDDINKGIERMRNSDFDGAIENFERVAEGNEKYVSARNYIAMCKIICDKCEEAEQECNRVLEKHPDNVQALTTLAAVKIQQRRIAEGRELAQRLLSVPTDEIEEIYKIATVCCENGMHEEAYQLFCKLEEKIGYDLTLLYFKAVSAYNSGHVQDCLDAFDKLLTIYPNAVTARFYYEFVRQDMEKEEDKRETLSYFYRLPSEVSKTYLEIISTVASSSKKRARELCENIDFAECLYWCFEEPEGDSADFVKIAGICAEKVGYDFFVRELLLNAFVPDAFKLGLLTDLCARNKDDEFGVVLCHVYKTLKTVPITLPRLKKKNFVMAYSRMVARFGIISEEYIYKFNKATRRAYALYNANGMLDKSADGGTLMAVIYKVSGVQVPGVTDANFYDCFDTDEQSFNKMIEVFGL